jgi:hypothetical protein
VSAIAATTGITSIAVVATYLRFSRHMGTTQDLPLLEMVGTLALVFGGVVRRLQSASQAAGSA